jgi:hypothetical protein
MHNYARHEQSSLITCICNEWALHKPITFINAFFRNFTPTKLPNMTLKTSSFLLLIPLCLLLSCRNEPVQKDEIITKKALPVVANTTEEDSLDKEKYAALLVPHQEDIEGYTFRYGYTAYDEDKYGFDNPGYMEVIKDGVVIFKDAFKGEGEPYITSLGHHSLDGDKLVFQLHDGTEACDYTQTARYYVADATGKFRYIKSYWGGTGGDLYATRYFKHIFPEDSLGKPNTLTIVEGMEFHEHDQPDQADTTHIVFSNGTFKASKLTDNISKVK